MSPVFLTYFDFLLTEAFVVTPAGPAKVTVGGLVLLQCCMQDNRISDTRSTADPKWSWERVLDGMKIVNSVPGKNYVLITNVKKEDAGEYVCEASAFGRRYTSTVTLEVDGKYDCKCCELGLCALRHGIQNSMATILPHHPALYVHRMTEQGGNFV